jgi:hypothetical protein
MDSKTCDATGPDPTRSKTSVPARSTRAGTEPLGVRGTDSRIVARCVYE